MNALGTHITLYTWSMPDTACWPYIEANEDVEYGFFKWCRCYPLFPPSYEYSFFHIGQFRNLQHVSLNFMEECVTDTSMDRHSFDLYRASGHPVGQPWTWRSNVLRALFESLNIQSHAATKVTSLSIKNLQTMTSESLLKSPAFKSITSRLTSLALQTTSECEHWRPQYDSRRPVQNDDDDDSFFGRVLKQCWLEPLQNQLKHLKLYAARHFWGYSPHCDLRDLHFPRLKSLTLGRMTLAYDWQLEWILSHSDTLEALVLDYCPIVQSNRRFADLGAYFHVSWDTYEARWHNYFRRIGVGLPKLKHFGFGYGSWKRSRAFEDAHQLSAGILYLGYCLYFREPTRSYKPEAFWIERAPEPRRRCNGEEVDYDYVHLDDQEYPKCEAIDRSALEELMTVIKNRR